MMHVLHIDLEVRTTFSLYSTEIPFQILKKKWRVFCNLKTNDHSESPLHSPHKKKNKGMKEMEHLHWQELPNALSSSRSREATEKSSLLDALSRVAEPLEITGQHEWMRRQLSSPSLSSPSQSSLRLHTFQHCDQVDKRGSFLVQPHVLQYCGRQSLNSQM